MSTIQRLNYFTSQFLVENDFQDEQAYHREMRHRHNRSLHTPGVVEGLIVSKAGERQIKVSAGMAIDPEGQEMILLAESGAIALSGANTDVFVTIQYGETKEVPDTTSGLVNQFRRIQEEPAIAFSTSRPSAEGAAILLASVKLDANGNIVGDPNNQARTEAGAAVAPNSIGTQELGDGVVTTAKIAPQSIGSEQLGDSSVTATKIANNTIDDSKLAPVIKDKLGMGVASSPSTTSTIEVPSNAGFQPFELAALTIQASTKGQVLITGNVRIICLAPNPVTDKPFVVRVALLDPNIKQDVSQLLINSSSMMGVMIAAQGVTQNNEIPLSITRVFQIPAKGTFIYKMFGTRGDAVSAKVQMNSPHLTAIFIPG
jgi:hypothetical protein